MLGIPLRWSDRAIEGAIGEVLADAGRAAVRITLTRGPAARGVLPWGDTCPTLLISAAPAPAPLPPARAIIAATTRRNEASPLSRIKSLNYLDSIIARREAEARGADEAILLNTSGFVAEATAATLFVVRGGVVATPPVEDGALPGIRRALLLEGGRVTERRMAPADLLAADAAFLGNSLGMRAIGSIEGRALDLDEAAIGTLCPDRARA